MKKTFALWDKMPVLNRLFRSGPDTSLPNSSIAKAEPYFDVAFYQEQSGQKFAKTHEAIEHFLTIGWRSNLSPSRSFSVSHYLSAYPDIGEAGINPLLHFLDSGWQENRLAFSVSGQINEMIGYQDSQMISLGPRPLQMHMEWASCNRLAGWVINVLNDQGEVQIYHHSKLIGCPKLHQDDFKTTDVTYSYFEMFLEGPLSPISARYFEGGTKPTPFWMLPMIK